MYLPGKISKTYSDELFKYINSSEDLPTLMKIDPEKAWQFIFRNLRTLNELNEIEREINMILDRLGMSVSGFIKIYSIDELVFGVKHYLIAWSTMKDLMAKLINSSLDLGIHENDISFGMILRNEKVKATKIPKICSEHSKIINVSYTDKQRNDAIHRGKLLDVEINEFRSKRNCLYGQRYGLLNPNKISESEFKENLDALNKELTNLVITKKTEYLEHFDKSMNLNIELAAELASLSALALR